MQRDADGDLFFGFCGARVYVPDDDPRAEGIADGVLRRFRERLAAELAKDKLRPDLHARLRDFKLRLRAQEPKDDFPDDYEV